MSYETRLIIGLTPEDQKTKYGLSMYVLATIELDGTAFDDTFIDASDKENPCSISGTQDDTIHEDAFASTLYAIDPGKVLERLRRQKPIYRRTAAAIALLKSLMENYEDEPLKCLLFGH